MNEVYDIIKQLEQTGSTNSKQEILIKNKENEVLKEVFRLAYSPTINFYMKQIPEYSTCNSGELNNLSQALNNLTPLSNRTVTGYEAKSYAKLVLEGTSPENAYLVECILKGDLRCGVGATLVNKVWKGLIVKPPRMGAKSMNEKSLKALEKKNLAIELKSDGSYIAFHKELMSRNGNPVNAEPLELHLNCGAFEGFALEGEGVFDESKADRSTGNGIVTKIVKGTASDEEKGGLIYQVWDCIASENYTSKGKYPVSNKDRRKLLEAMYNNYLMFCNKGGFTPKIQLIPRVEGVTMEEANEIFERYVKAGFEGAILKDMDAPWVDNGKPSCSVKMKRKDSADLVCIGIYEGTGKAKGMLGGITLESIEGRVKVNCGSGFSDEERVLYFNSPNSIVGKVVEVEYDSITKDKKTGQESLFLPIYKQVRCDKIEPDSYKEIKDKVVIK